MKIRFFWFALWQEIYCYCLLLQLSSGCPHTLLHFFNHVLLLKHFLEELRLLIWFSHNFSLVLCRLFPNLFCSFRRKLPLPLGFLSAISFLNQWLLLHIHLCLSHRRYLVSYHLTPLLGRPKKLWARHIKINLFLSSFDSLNPLEKIVYCLLFTGLLLEVKIRKVEFFI